MCDIPVEIADEEKIVRAVKTPQHVHKKKPKLKPAAFRPPPERDDLSVMRKDHMGANACKAQAQSLSKPPVSTYCGLAVIGASEVRGTKASLVDSREGQFCGHAHIEQGVPAPAPGESAPPWLQEKYKMLSDAARFYVDPEPEREGWTGEDLI